MQGPQAWPGEGPQNNMIKGSKYYLAKGLWLPPWKGDKWITQEKTWEWILKGQWQKLDKKQLDDTQEFIWQEVG